MGDAWSPGTYERLAAGLGPVHEQLLEAVAVADGDELLDLATGSGQLALKAARAGAKVTAVDVHEPILALAREQAADDELDATFDQADVEYLPYENASFDVLVSSFGLVFAPDHANVAAELARVARPGARLGFTAWRPNPKLGELYRRFTDEPIAGREAYEWGREDHVEDMLGEEFELEFEDGTVWLEADSGEEIWGLFSESSPPMVSLVERLSRDDVKELHRSFVELYESYRTESGGIRAPRRYLLVLGRRK